MNAEIIMLFALILLMLFREYRAGGIDKALDFLIKSLQESGVSVKDIAKKSSSSVVQNVLLKKSKEEEKKEEEKK